MMALAQLDADERAFLSAPLVADSAFAQALAARIAALLGARLRQPVRVSIEEDLLEPAAPQPRHDSAIALHWNAELDVLWLTGRLRCAGSVPGSRASSILGARLYRSLSLALAEVWLSRPPEVLPAQLGLAIQGRLPGARLGISFSSSRAAIVRWARQTIEHGE
jgi:hypothetical protein